MRNVYYIGGSPCSGKSTVAEILAEEYNLYYFKVDDFLERYTAMGAHNGFEICMKQSQMNCEETWMRNPQVQCREELIFYCEIYEFIKEDINMISSEKDIITEGAAFLPELMKRSNIDSNNYICITPTKEFQIEHYKKREWVSYVLEGCHDKKKAFENWMDRDALFAESVRKQCEDAKYKSIITNDQIDIKDIIKITSQQFNLRK